ncbi:DUF3089 domain-containing protein [Novosphingobium sp. Gsoil 351]|uniref:DUF3089 domain-containing protein n=1 Tax=Novosphingobium sp. Gsoil 351 TaxID=2675225 RepID=UPI0012B45D05|nr:DUF3089 domain-containing protein [Novosphingobium sp. Gsoil 351]QGN54412.1 DUF3089 domain-containing protein [Novosphingobium sp. Gsoil 351]
MVRKFLYFIVFCIVVGVAGVVALRYYARDLTELAFVPKVRFETQNPLAGNAYDDPAMWISRPGMSTSDPVRWLPAGLTEDGDALGAAVFFVHPTSYLAREHWNAPLADAEANDRARLFVRGMASPFNSSPEIWAPRYRQATFGAFLTNQPEAQQAIEAAYADVAKAFDYFLASVPAGRPIVLAGHSQGSRHLIRLLKEKVAGTPLQRRVAAVYAIGWPISVAHDLPALGLPACAIAGQAGCIVSWSSFAEPADPSQLKSVYAESTGFDGQPRGGSEMLCTNPLTGKLGGTAPADANLGTLVPDAALGAGKLTPKLVPARCTAGLLLIGPPPALGPYVLPGNNYHVYDIPLFWANLRADVKARVQAWKP